MAVFRFLALMAILSMVACSQPPTTRPQGAAGAAPATTPSGRTLVAALKAEPATIALRPLQDASGVGLYLTDKAFNASLALMDYRGVALPYLAESLPQLDSDDWRIFPDGTMETTFHLRPNLTWHDGTTLAADDFVFAWELYSRPELGVARRLPMDALESVSAPDPRTVAMKWKRAYPDAGTLTDRNADLPPLPRHLLQKQFDGANTDTISNNPYWNREFVGVGPFKLDRWEPGSFIEATAFEGHALGKPKIARIRIVFIADSQTVIANLISGDVQLAAVDAVRLDQALSLMRDWEPKKAGGMMPHPNQWRAVFFQLRQDYANPKALLNPAVRKAMAHAIDRSAINDAVYGGSLEFADSMISSHSEWADAVKGPTIRYAYDLRRSEQLMTDAGFARVSGTWTSPQDGRFTSELKTNGATDNEQEMTILAAGWREAGFNVTDAVLPIAQAQDNEVRATFPGMYSNNGPLGEGGMTNQASTRIPSQDNRWNGANRGGWVNRDYDRLLDAYSTTLDRDQRGKIVGQLVGIFTEDLPAISLFFRVQPWIFASSLKGLDHVAAPETLQSWNIHEWEMVQP